MSIFFTKYKGKAKEDDELYTTLNLSIFVSLPTCIKRSGFFIVFAFDMASKRRLDGLSHTKTAIFMRVQRGATK